MEEKKRGPGRPPGSKNSKSNKRSSKNHPKAKARAQEIQAERKADKKVLDEIWAIITIAIGVFFVVATFTNGAGKFGSAVDLCVKGLFGFMAYVLPFYLIIFGLLLFTNKTTHFCFRSFLLLFIALLMICTINSMRYIDFNDLSIDISRFYEGGKELNSGGFFGMILASIFVKWFGQAGCWIITIVVTIICILLLINTPVSRFFTKISDKLEERRLIKENAHLDDASQDEAQIQEKTSNHYSDTSVKPGREIKIVNSSVLEQNEERKPAPILTPAPVITPAEQAHRNNNVLKYMKDGTLFGNKESNESGTFGIEETRQTREGYGIDGTSKEKTSPIIGGVSSGTADNKVQTDYPDQRPAKQAADKISNKEAREAMLNSDEINTEKTAPQYKKPPISLLEKAVGSNPKNDNILKAKAIKLEDTLRNFHVDARVVQVTQGPTVTRYEIQPAVGVKVSSIVRLADDIALNLEAKSIRIEAPIPGKAAVGIEVENGSVTMVHLREIIDSDAFRNSKSKISFAVGKDISGNCIVGNLKAMPHLLIAGSTGSGKSVCINSIITSLLYKANPDEVKLILIDPKVVELGNYNGIPHLLIPVVTDPTKAAAALNWAVAEMNERYKKFAEEGVRDLETYNESVKADDELEKVLPQVVIIIDELADLMMAAPAQIEESICRLAQMARAAGMHLIVATQRPSVDVITGVIKANIPSRIAFAVSSSVDSRTILDMQGAEKLVGKGDMLYNPMGMGKPIRVQGTFVSDKEVHKVIEFVKNQVEETKYSQEVMSKLETTNPQQSSGDDDDELVPEAVELVVRSGQASVSMLQRRFRIGYNRAARIIDMLEAKGIIGPPDGSRPRQVLMTMEEYERLANGSDNPQDYEENMTEKGNTDESVF